ncbi:uncharacterized protein LOC123698682 [Colias croceus]|uniref:uncharacterized protein LOC123698682 n=1 Tax=Colias crocea TaxID=72248 RepID=UPI001E27B327|nr:uncharacterized protein LOC123698682 [Colias croceus]
MVGTGIKFKVIGTSRASWTRSSPTIPYIKIYSEKSKIFYVNIDVFREINGKTVEPGVINFPFHFALPPDLPSSFKDTIAKIFYRIIIQSKIAFKIRQKVIYPLSIISSLNLNQNGNYSLQSFFEVSKTFKKFDEFSLIIRTYKGVAIKQRLPFEAIINNDRKVKVTKITATLIQKLEYSVSSGYYNAEKKINKVEHKNLVSSLRETCSFFMDIPQIQPSSINVPNTMVNISYIIKVKACFRFHRNVSMDIPLVIGTTPVIYS